MAAKKKTATKKAATKKIATKKIATTTKPTPGRGPTRSFSATARGMESIEITSDGTRALIGGWFGPATYALADGKLVRAYREQIMRSINWDARMSGDGALVVAGYGDCVLHFMNGETGASLRTHRLDGIVTSVSIASGAKRILTGQPQKKMRLWDFSGEQLLELKGHRAYCWKAALSPDARLAASFGLVDPTIHCWDLEAQKELSVLPGHAKAIVGVAMSPAGGVLASASKDGAVRLWRFTAQKREQLSLLGSHPKVAGLAFSHDGTRLATCGGDSLVRVWDVAKGTMVESLTAPEPLGCVAFTPRGDSVVAGGTSVHVF